MCDTSSLSGVDPQIKWQLGYKNPSAFLRITQKYERTTDGMNSKALNIWMPGVIQSYNSKINPLNVSYSRRFILCGIPWLAVQRLLTLFNVG